MLTDFQFEDWCKRNNTSAEARTEIERIRSSPPARRVRSGSNNVIGHYNQSVKMAHTIQFESKSIEGAALFTMDRYDKTVLEIWDQPPSFTVRYVASSGRRAGHLYTADFFVIRTDCAGWEEWKPESRLLTLAARNPNKYRKDEKGLWHFPPGEEYATQFGLYFRVGSSTDLNWTLIRNYKVLSPFFQELSS